MREIKVLSRDEYYMEDYFFNRSLETVRQNIKWTRNITFRLPKEIKERMLDQYHVDCAYYDCGDLVWEDNFSEVWNEITVKEISQLAGMTLDF